MDLWHHAPYHRPQRFKNLELFQEHCYISRAQRRKKVFGTPCSSGTGGAVRPVRLSAMSRWAAAQLQGQTEQQTTEQPSPGPPLPPPPGVEGPSPRTTSQTRPADDEVSAAGKQLLPTLHKMPAAAATTTTAATSGGERLDATAALLLG